MPFRSFGLFAAVLLLVATPAFADPPPPPLLSVPEAVTAEPESRRGAVVTFRTSATDWKGETLPVVCEPRAGSLFPLGRTRVVCIATDRRHESTSGSFPLTVEHLYRPREGASVPSSQPLRFAWYGVKGALLYNLQLWRSSERGWRKVASVFPLRARFFLQPSWRYQGRRHRLLPGGSYVWYAWPWLGSHYGPLLGSNSFRVR